MRKYGLFQHKEAVFRIACSEFDAVTSEIVSQRGILEDYITGHEEFGSSFQPINVHADAPESAQRMSRAAFAAGVGPMAAVAGTMAQLAGEAGMNAGSEEVIVENGGDIFLSLTHEAVIALYPGEGKLKDTLALKVLPEDTPIAICSSSGRMGHSTSLGDCDLATVIAKDCSLADAAATYAANLVRSADDMDTAMARIMEIAGISGVLLVHNDRIGLIGTLPELVKKT